MCGAGRERASIFLCTLSGEEIELKREGERERERLVKMRYLSEMKEVKERERERWVKMRMIEGAIERERESCGEEER